MTTTDIPPAPSPEPATPAARVAHLILEIGGVLIALAIGVGIMFYLMTNKPVATRSPAEAKPLPVDIVVAAPTDAPLRLRATGVVMAARQTALQSELNGTLTWMAPGFDLGAIVTADQELTRIDDRDWQATITELEATLSQHDAEITRLQAVLDQSALEVEQRQRELEQRDQEILRAQNNLELEEAQAEAARQEYELIRGQTPGAEQALVLRAPQGRSAVSQVATARSARASAEVAVRNAQAGIRSATASLASAVASRSATEAKIAAARVTLSRTRVVAPFTALVTERAVAEGTHVGPGTIIASLVAVDEFWVEVTVPVADLAHIQLPTDGQVGSTVAIRADGWPPGVTRQGTVLRGLGSVEQLGQMARILVSVPDPLGLADGAPPLLLKSFVEITIHGRHLPSAVVLPADAVHGGDQVYIADAADLLAERTVVVAWRDDSHVYLSSGVQPGERIIVSTVASPQLGTPLSINSPTTERKDAGE